MNIAFITPEYPIASFQGNIGGIGTFTKNLAEQLVNNNCKVTVFIYSQSKDEIRVKNGVEIHLVQKKMIKGITWYSNRKYFNKYVNKVILKNNIQIIEAPEWTGFTAFMKFHCPLVIRLHGSDTYFCDLEKRKVKFKNKFFEKKALLGAANIIGASNFVSQRTQGLFRLKKEIPTINNAINTVKFTPNHQNTKPKSLLYFGTIVRKKGVLEIAKMFTQLVEQDNEVTLTLLGKDNIDIFTGTSTLRMMNELLSEKAKQKTTYIKAVPYEEVLQYIAQAAIVLLPSFAEAFPMTWLEAMAMEKKLVTSNIGWANELMIDGETGFMIYPKNTEDFVKRVKNLLDDNAELNKIGLYARLHIQKNFNQKESVLKNMYFYKKMIVDEV